MKKFRAKKKDMVMIATALPTAMLTLIPWSIRQKKHSKRRNDYLRKVAREFNAKYGKTIKMNWSMEKQKMTITRSEIKAKVIKEEKTNEKLHTKSNPARQVNNGKKAPTSRQVNNGKKLAPARQVNNVKKLAVSKAEISKRKPKKVVKTDQVDPFADFRNA